jgi:hypothetical protein
MAEKILNTRIQLKYDSYENWSKIDVEGQGANLVLKEGEIGICYIPEKTVVNGIKNPPHVMMKVGDGQSTFASLKWLSARAADVEDWAKAETKPVYSAEEITGIGEYIAKYVDEELGISVDTNTVYQIVKVDDNHYKLQSKAAGTEAWADVVGSEIVIPESTKVEASTTNGNIKVDGEEVKVYDDIFVTDITTVNALGGIAAGANLNGMSTHEILNTLLFPYVAFTLGSTSRTAAAATLENGATQTLNSASISITKKSKPITSVKLLNGSTVLGEKTGDEVAAGGTITFSNLGITVSKSNNPNLKFTVTDGQTSTDKSVGASTFVYPYYTGECAADATIDEVLIEGLTKKVESKGAKTVTHTCENGRMIIAYPKAHGVLKSILDPNNFETIGDYTRSEVSVTGLDGTAQTYYVYASGAATVNGFKVQYKY